MSIYCEAELNPGTSAVQWPRGGRECSITSTEMGGGGDLASIDGHLQDAIDVVGNTVYGSVR